ncbi:MAG TPA: nuclear transport factor 2 family protein, partial [Solirubrobacteraceae bacterium]|nr:nuclear transport factor 2 family protein [Solirubrobacteraceae bacterium]
MALRLEDIELIRQLKYKYFRSIDMGDIATLREVLTEDVKVDYIGGSYRWQMAGRDKILESIAGSFNANAVGCHTGHHPEIDVLTDTTATGLWYLTDVFINLA